jgi:putative CocE/NonD family hydrolase
MRVVTRREVMVPMRDGVRLATDLYFPPDFSGSAPVLLERLPYDKNGVNHADRSATDPSPLSKPEIARRFAEAGYVCALQDCRGRFASEGTFVKYLSEGEDGVDTLAWLVAQPWCDGRVGTFGLSYGAHVQSALAAFDPPGLGAMFLDSGGFSSAFHSGIRQGGAFELKQLTWALKHARLSPLTAADPERRRALEQVDISDWVGVRPWTVGNSPLAAAPEYEAYVLGQWAREAFDDFWRHPALYGRGHYDRMADVPMVHMSSWYDPYALAATENYVGLSALKRGPVRLVMGPWTHGQRSVTHAGDIDFGAAATLDGSIAPDYLALRLAWFDRHLRGRDAPDYLEAPVTLFVMGGGSGRRNSDGRLDHGGAWLRTSAWPPPGTVPTRFHLGDGTLGEAPPEGAGARSFVHDPLDPVPTIGGATASGAPLMVAGAFDQREPGGRALAERDDVLVFETAPLVRDLIVIGDVEAVLSVSSSAPDSDIAVRLIDVYPPSADYPRGYAMNLSHGILRLRFREGFEQAKPMEPGRIYQVRIRCFPTANLFKAGHRIRLEVAGSNFPHFDINPNTGAPAGVPSEPVPARNGIHFSAEHPSYILLPIAEGVAELR